MNYMGLSLAGLTWGVSRDLETLRRSRPVFGHFGGGPRHVIGWCRAVGGLRKAFVYWAKCTKPTDGDPWACKVREMGCRNPSTGGGGNRTRVP